MSEYVRSMSLNGKVVIKQAKTDASLFQEVRRIGVNLNQVTRNFNATGDEPIELRQALTQCNSILEKIIKSL